MRPSAAAGVACPGSCLPSGTGAGNRRHLIGQEVGYGPSLRQPSSIPGGIMEARRAEWPLLLLGGKAGMIRAVAALLWLALGMPQPAVAQQPDVACQQTGAEKRRLECAVRFEPPREIRSVSAAVAGGTRTLPEPVIDR